MYQSFVGLEIHIHLLTASKVFCGCRSSFGDEPNTNVCPVCMGYPGVLPALNLEAMRMGSVVARALGCRISPVTWFERKQYFYPDMPKNYQISQFASPLGVDGEVELEFRRNRKKVRIKECHLEEDAGKMIHAGDTSLLDYNRAGVSLLEIVTEPDLEIGEEAELFLQQLRRTVRYLGVCDGNMEEGSMRCDANVSVNLRGQGLGRKVEIKNLNSSRFVRLALNYEIERQTGILEKGGTVRQETRLWNENRDQTESMRSKESANDYRYFPEPDLPVFVPDAAFLASVDAGIVELPAAREKRLVAQYGLQAAQAAWLCEEKAVADWFEEAAGAATGFGSGGRVTAAGAGTRAKAAAGAGTGATAAGSGGRVVADRAAAGAGTGAKAAGSGRVAEGATGFGSGGRVTAAGAAAGAAVAAAGAVTAGGGALRVPAERLVAWMSSDVKRIMNRDGIAPEHIGTMRLTPSRLAALVAMIEKGTISGKIAKQVLELVFAEDKDPESIVEEKGWAQITDPAVIADAVESVLAAEPEAATAAAEGDVKIFGYLVGKVLAATGGRADPKLARSALESRFPEKQVDLVAFSGAITGRNEGGLIVAGSGEGGPEGTGSRLAVLSGHAGGAGVSGGIAGGTTGAAGHAGFAAGAAGPGAAAGVAAAAGAGIAEAAGAAAGAAAAAIGRRGHPRVNAEVLGSFLSEELSPVEWSRLVGNLAQKVAGEPAKGIVVAHGTDTLAYTAPFLQWLFGDCDTRIVLAASTRAPSDPQDAAALLEPGLRAAAEKGSGGVLAVVDGMRFDPLNLKFLKVEEAGFGTWNGELLASNPSLPSSFPSSWVMETLGKLPEQEILARAEAAARSSMILKVFPGMRGSIIATLVSAGIRTIFLELYDTGTAAVSSSPYSLKEAMRSAREAGAAFYCTSQQEGIVDFSGYVTAHELWKEGAIPMGALSTESAYARFVAAWIVAGSESGARAIMEEDDARTGI